MAIVNDNKIILLIGASGSGKSTLGRALEDMGVPQLISYTTRPMREGETQDVHYYFVDEKWLSYNVRDTDIIERTTYDGNEYGLFRIEIEEKLKRGDVYFVCNKDGARQIMNFYPDNTTAFWLKIDAKTLRERLEHRGDSAENIESRLKHALDTKEFVPPNLLHFRLDATRTTEYLSNLIMSLTLIEKI